MAEHSLSDEQARQVFVPVAQMGVVPEQVLLSVHWTHAPLAAHAVCPEKLAQSLPVAQPRQVFVVVAQMGAVPAQVVFVRHCTHLLLVVLQTLVAPAHFVLFVLVHCTHAPLVAHATRTESLSPAQSVSAAHAWHFSLVPQIGVAPEQSAAVVHPTQVLVVVSHAGVAPVHEVLTVVAVHCTHCPSDRQAGRAAFLVWHCKSAAQAAQTFLVVSQTGAAAEAHWRLAVQPTHLPLVVSQTPVGAVHMLTPPSRPG
jgi:hypothetical protein